MSEKFLAMSAPHSQFLPVVALQLVLQVERYRRAIGELAAHPHDEAAREAAVFARSVAAPLAFAIPAVWPSWGQMVVRHSEFMRDWMNGTPLPGLRQAWERLDASAEVVACRCVDWSLREQKHYAVPGSVAAPFLAWDRARRACLTAARDIAVLREQEGAVPLELRERHEQCALDTVRLLGEALSALRRGGARNAAAQDADAPAATRRDHADLETLQGEWRIAEEAASDAELAIAEMHLNGLPVSPAQREFAQRLRSIARACREAVFEAGRL